jgi:hypothetical protein
MWFPKAAIERYSLNPKPKVEEKRVASNLHPPKKVDISSFTLEGTGGAAIPITDKDGRITSVKGVSQEMLSGYQKIVNKYLEKQSTGNSDTIDKYYWKSDTLSEEDWTRLYAVYFQMTPDQQKEQMISFWGPTPYFDRSLPPFQGSYDRWIEDKDCKIWIDGKKVDNSILNSYKTTDFFRYFTSKLFRSGGRTEDYRVDLWTEAGLKKFSEQLYGQPVSIDKALEIEPKILFEVEKDDNKPVILFLDPEPLYGWYMSKVTKISGDTVYSIGRGNAPTPTTYHNNN